MAKPNGQMQTWMKILRFEKTHPFFGRFRITVELPFKWHWRNRKKTKEYIGKEIVKDLHL